MRKHSLIGWALGTLVLWCGTSVATADFIVQYEMAGQPGDQATTAPTFSAAGTTGVNLTRGAGLTPNAGANSMNSAGWVGPSSDDFYSYGFDVSAGRQVIIDALRLSTRSSATGPGLVNLLYSVDNGPETLITTFTQVGTNFTDSLLTLTPLTVRSSLRIILRSANNTAAGGGTVGTAGTLRIGDFSPDGGQTFDPISIEGRVTAAPTTPEPASALLLVVGGLGLLGMARFQSRTPRALAA